MNPLPLHQIVHAVSGQPVGVLPDLTISAVCTDTRSMQPNSLFIAISGESHDGHKFVPPAANAGAIAALVDHDLPESAPHLPIVLIRVGHTRGAMGVLARYVRQKMSAKVIGVGGSNGKTGTKNLIDSILRVRLRGTISPKSFNNNIGVPLAIFPADPEQDYLVLELGTNHPGELRVLTNIALPDIAVITNCAAEHLEGFGDLDGVRKEEASIIEGLNPRGLLIVNGDDPRVLEAVAGWTGERITFGRERTNDLFASDIVLTLEGVRFRLNGKREMSIPLLGAHVAINALAAIAVARRMGLSDDEIAAGLASAHGPEMRLQVQKVRGMTLLNDAYNANPASMQAALETVEALAWRGRRIAVLGDMFELGDSADEAHRELGRLIKKNAIDHLVCVGGKGGSAGKRRNRRRVPGRSHHSFCGHRFGRCWHAPDAQRGRPGAVQRLAGHEARADRPCDRFAGRGEKSVMIYLLIRNGFPWLDAHGLGFLHVFTYATFRAMAGIVLSFLLCIVLGPRLIAWLRRQKIADDAKVGQAEMDRNQEIKAGTPTMGGILIISAIIVTTLLLADLTNFYIVMALVCALGLALVGAVDDWLKLTVARRQGSRQGLKAWEKLVFQVGLAIILACYTYNYGVNITQTHTIFFPFFKYAQIDLGKLTWLVPGTAISLGLIVFVLISTLVLTGSSNAVNLTDGMDGLAGGCMAIVSFTFFVLALIVGTSTQIGEKPLATYLYLPYVKTADEMAIVAGAMTGACLGFLWFNCNPAEVFMGDTGSLSLGGLLGYTAIVIRQELLLVLVGGIFVIEALSVVIQVGYFKYTKHRYGEGRRVFLMSPIHWHFRKKGWTETQVVVRFWLITAMLCAMALATVKLR